MKKIFLFLVLICFLNLLPSVAYGASITYPVVGGNIIFDTDTGAITGYSGSPTNVNIPATINGVEVISISSLAFSGCNSLTKITLPDAVPGGATGVTTIGNSVFYNCTNLKEVSLPNSITKIGSSAFYGCVGLTKITLPGGLNKIEDSLFHGCTNLTEVVLPDLLTAIGSRAFYNCRNLKKITIPYTVSSIVTNTFIGCDNITIVCFPNSYAYEFAEQNRILIELIAVTNRVDLIIQDTQGTVLPTGYNINWYEKNSDVVINIGNTFYNYDPSKDYEFEIILDSSNGIIYYQPPRQDLVIGNDTNINVTLSNIDSITVNGKVLDDQQNPIVNAQVTIEQIVNLQYSILAQTVTTDVNGDFQAVILDGDIIMTISANGFYDKIPALDSFAVIVENSGELGDFNMEPLSANFITLTLNKNSAVIPGGSSTTTPITSFENLSFSLVNVTQGNTDITSFRAQFPNIYLDSSNLNQNDEIKISIIDNLNQMTMDAVTVTLDANLCSNANIQFIENGYFRVNSFTSQNTESLSMVFDDDGRFVNTYTNSGNSFVSASMPEGNYQVVFIGKSALLTRVAHIDTLLNLVDSTDYILENIHIANGVITELNNIVIPTLDESKLYYTTSASLDANKTILPVGNMISVRAEYSIADEHETSNEAIKIELPNDLGVFEGSVTIDSNLVPYTISGNTLTVITNKKSAVVRFYLTTTTIGQYIVEGFLSFNKDNENFLQSIGQLSIDVVELEIELPPRTSSQTVTAKGVAVPDSVINIRAVDELSGQTILTDPVTVNENGHWMITFELADTGRSHSISVFITDKYNNTVLGGTKMLIYDSQYTDVSTLTLIQNDEEIVIDYFDPSSSAPVYIFDPKKPKFTFKIEFTDPDATKVSDVWVKTKDSNGNVTHVETVYDRRNNVWVGAADYNVNTLPINIGVFYIDIYEQGGPVLFSDIPPFVVNGTPLTYCLLAPIIDPSGYVYEAVPSNRLENVTATAYFKDEEGNTVLWDATNYEQINPLMTDKEGRYAWDVPFGQWQVKYEKEGFETAYSQWLPVPPIQTDVNIGLVSKAPPVINAVYGYEDYIEVVFDKYMDTSFLTNDNIQVILNSDSVECDIITIDAEIGVSSLSKIIHITPTIGKFTATDVVNITIKKDIESYAGVNMVNDYVKNVSIEKEHKYILLPERINLEYLETTSIEVSLFPAGINKEITAKSMSPSIVSIDSHSFTNDEGTAIFNIYANMPGETTLVFNVNGTTLESTIVVNVSLPGAENLATVELGEMQIISDATVTFSIPVINNSGETITPVLYVCLYSDTEELLQMSQLSNTIDSGETKNMTLSFNSMEGGNDCFIKAFLWNENSNSPILSKPTIYKF